MAIRDLDQYIEVHRELYKHLDFNGSEIEVVLKGHLLVENVLNRLLEKAAQNEKLITSANLSFFKLACVVQAIYEKECPAWVWESVMLLNTIRNKLAHELENPKVDALIEEFSDQVRTNGDGTIAVSYTHLTLPTN